MISQEITMFSHQFKGLDMALWERSSPPPLRRSSRVPAGKRGENLGKCGKTWAKMWGRCGETKMEIGEAIGKISIMCKNPPVLSNMASWDIGYPIKHGGINGTYLHKWKTFHGHAWLPEGIQTLFLDNKYSCERLNIGFFPKKKSWDNISFRNLHILGQLMSLSLSLSVSLLSANFSSLLRRGRWPPARRLPRPFRTMSKGRSMSIVTKLR